MQLKNVTADVMNIMAITDGLKRAAECIKMHHFGEHAKIFLGRGRGLWHSPLPKPNPAGASFRPPKPHFSILAALPVTVLVF